MMKAKRAREKARAKSKRKIETKIRSILQMKCIPCEGGIPPMPLEKINRYLKQIEDWSLEEQFGIYQITKEYKFKNFKEAINFINKVADIAEAEGHHPDIYLYSYKRVKLTLYTHTISGLHENDFIVAAKVDNMLKME